MAIATIADIIRTHGAERPDAIAVEVDDRSVTFGELDRRSSQVANALAAAGVTKGDRVASIDKNGVEFFEVTFGLAKIGAVNVAVNWRLAPAEMLQIIDDAKSKVVLVAPEFYEHVEKIEGELAPGAHDRRSWRAPTLGRLRGMARGAAGHGPGGHVRRRSTSPSSSTRRARPGCPRA